MNIGKIPERILEHSILHQIHTKRREVVSGAGLGADCAIFALADGERPVVCVREAAVALQAQGAIRADITVRNAASTDAVVGTDTVAAAAEAVVGKERAPEHAYPAEAVSMAHLIQKCANNLAVCGAKLVAMMITLMLPQTAEAEDVKKLMQEAEAACAGLSVQIAGGQTRISGAVRSPVAVVSGYGSVLEQDCRTLGAVRPGQDIVLSKWVGLEGTAVLAERHRDALKARYPAYLAEEAQGFDKYLSIIPEAATAMKSGVCAMHDASEGGIFAALWEFAEGAGIGLDIDLKKIPLRQETVEICECCGANPYELLSGGCLVMAADNGEKLAAALRAEGIPAAVVGQATQGNGRIIRNGEEVRYLDRPKADAVYGNE